MLQQTQVSTVIDYYQRFLASFPDVKSLADASTEAVLAHWSGLGYYARARNLHKAARMVMEEFAGQFPGAPEALVRLPGIGRSTANAIAAFAFGVPAPILDGNVKRVLMRHLGIEAPPTGAALEQRLWAVVHDRVPADATHAQMIAYTQGMMDLGNMVCARSKPACQLCPVASDCEALHRGLQNVIPLPKPKKTVPERETVMAVWQHDGQLALQKRPDTGIWGGLWSFPEYPAVDDVPGGKGQLLPAFMHVFTHFKLHITPLLMQGPNIPQDLSLQWFPLADALALGLPQPIRRIIETIAASQQEYRLQSRT